MKTRIRKPWAVVAGIALFASTASGVAYAATSFTGNPDSLAWYSADETAVTANPDKSAATLTLYNAAGTAVTSGSVSAKPFVAYAATSAPLRSGDDHASLFAYTANPGLAQGAWTGEQLTAANTFPVAGAPAGVGSNPVVKGAATSLSLADYIAGYENTSTATGFEDVYEIRLRSSSASQGVGTTYASTFVKVTGDTWTVTSSPVNLTSTSTTSAVPASARYGTAFNVTATVTPTDASVPAGTVSVLEGPTVVATGTLASGAATITVPGTRLAPGSHALVLRYNGSGSLAQSSATAKTVVVAKALSTTSARVVKTPLKKTKVPAVVVTVRAAGLKPTGTIRIYAGSKVLKTVTLTAANNGVITIKLPKFKVAKKYTLVAKYAGSGTVGASNARAVTIKITK
ncbi:Ig-like domain repeat protein [Marmoricola sp. RAF53]|uniref:Ig-like domain repeat protein n=1 Tax=Marmoricola sp. RAF53 TaxID=3233059 RepID=UPI003F9C4682